MMFSAEAMARLVAFYGWFPTSVAGLYVVVKCKPC